MSAWTDAFRRRLPWQGYATGGQVRPGPPTSGDSIPEILSPCTYTVRRPGETWVEADTRLIVGEDL